MTTTTHWHTWLEAWFSGQKNPKHIYFAQHIRYDGASQPIFIAAKSKKSCNKALLQNIHHEALTTAVLRPVCCGHFAHEDMARINEQLGLDPYDLLDKPQARERLRDHLLAQGDNTLVEAIETWQDRDAEGGYTRLEPLRAQQLLGAQLLLPTQLQDASAAQKAAHIAPLLQEGRCQAHFTLYDQSLRVLLLPPDLPLVDALLCPQLAPALLGLLGYVHTCIRGPQSQYTRGEGNYQPILDLIEARALEQAPQAEFSTYLKNFEILDAQGWGAFDGDEEWIYDWEDAAPAFYQAEGRDLVLALLREQKQRLQDLLRQSFFFLKGADTAAPAVLARPFTPVTLR
jgi:hypothetical protein